MIQITHCHRALLLISCVTLCGCIEKPDASRKFVPFKTKSLDSCLAIVVDLSGSFHNDWQKDGRAHRLFFELVTQFFTDGMGQDTRVVLGQISDSDNFILFDGTPQELTRRFRSPEDLNRFLRKNAMPSGSRVYDSTKAMFDYLNEMPEATEKTRMLTVVLSDLKESEPDKDARSESGRDMVVSLTAYAKSGGGVALYFVAEKEKIRWKRLLAEAGFSPGSFVIEGTLSETPQLPRFD